MAAQVAEVGPRCPIGTERIDENAARLNGGLVAAMLVISVLTPYRWVLALLVVDFALKVFAGFATSPVCKVTRVLADAMRLPRHMTDSAPKRFAAVIGLVMCAIALFLAYALPGAPIAYRAVAGTVLIFATLEAAAGVCVGCWIYSWLPESASRVFVRVKHVGV